MTHDLLLRRCRAHNFYKDNAGRKKLVFYRIASMLNLQLWSPALLLSFWDHLKIVEKFQLVLKYLHFGLLLISYRLKLNINLDWFRNPHPKGEVMGTGYAGPGWAWPCKAGFFIWVGVVATTFVNEKNPWRQSVISPKRWGSTGITFGDYSYAPNGGLTKAAPLGCGSFTIFYKNEVVFQYGR